MSMTDRLIDEGVLVTPAIIKAFRDIKRVDFLPKDITAGTGAKRRREEMSEADDALPIGYAQTISQPTVVAFMFELLDPRPGEKILDIGSGSGWTTALLASIVSARGKKGRVIAVERIAELKEFGEKNVSKYDFVKNGVAKFYRRDGSGGFADEAPFDRILASAQGACVPEAWINQLKTGGRIVAPAGQSIWSYDKLPGGIVEKCEYPGFVFVPLISDNNDSC